MQRSTPSCNHREEGPAGLGWRSAKLTKIVSKHFITAHLAGLQKALPRKSE